MRGLAPHQKLPARTVAVGLASALTLAACGAAGDVDAVADVRTVNSQSNAVAPDTTSASTIPAIDNGDQPATDDGAAQVPGLPVASDQVEAAPIAEPANSANDDAAAADNTSTTQGAVTTSTPTVSETTAVPTTQPPPTTQAPTTSPPVVANLPNLAVIDIASGSSIGFSQAAQSNGLPVLLWFWSPT